MPHRDFHELRDVVAFGLLAIQLRHKHGILYEGLVQKVLICLSMVSRTLVLFGPNTERLFIFISPRDLLISERTVVPICVSAD